MRRSLRPWMLAFATIAPFLLSPASGSASDALRTLVLPLRSVGVSDTTVAVVGDLLRGEIEGRGVPLVAAGRSGAVLPSGEAACDEPECAAALAESLGAERVVYGSLSRLGDKIFLRIRALRLGDPAPYYVDQITATTEEDLDAVARRAADGIAAGRPNAEHATIETVTEEETFEPRRRASRAGIGLRAGFLFPDSESYGDTDRLGSLRFAIKYEARNFLIETTPLTGIAWRGDTVEWSLLDVFGARIFGIGDFAPYLGAGLGLHAVRIEQEYVVPVGGGMQYEESREDSQTTLTADVGIGLLALRTYDFMLVLDVRYHYVFANFDDVGGQGAHGILISFGTSR